MKSGENKDHRNIIKDRLILYHLSLDNHRFVSYLPISTIINVLDMDVPDYIKIAISKGYKFRINYYTVSCIKFGAVHVYDENRLSNLLNKKYEILINSG